MASEAVVLRAHANLFGFSRGSIGHYLSLLGLLGMSGYTGYQMILGN